MLSLVFYLLAAVTLFSAVAVITVSNPIYCALFLATTMLGVAGLFFSLEAYFIAGVQLIVYAGAVVVMFVMVLMLFDLKQERRAFTRGMFSMFLKLASAGLIFSSIAMAIVYSLPAVKLQEGDTDAMLATKAMAMQLFSKHVFGFEVIGVLLLVVLVGAMAIAKGRGGTHA